MANLKIVFTQEDSVYSEKVSPHDSDAENSVIGSLLLDGDSITKITGFLKPEDFYSEKNKFCYQACLNLASRNEPINQISVSHELAIHEQLPSIGGNEYLSSLVNSVPSPTHIYHFGQLVRKTSIMRQLIGASSEIAQIGYDNEPDTENALTKAEDLLFSIRSDREVRDFTHIREVYDQYMEESNQGPDMARLAPIFIVSMSCRLSAARHNLGLSILPL